MIKLIRTNSDNTDFISLVTQLDHDLAERDGAEHSFYDQFNKVVNIKHVVLAYTDNVAVSCGAFKEHSHGAVEIKRMYTLPIYRGKGIAALVLGELEKWSTELSYIKCVLETGKKQPEAIRLYQKNGYQITSNYGQYVGIKNSICFEKDFN